MKGVKLTKAQDVSVKLSQVLLDEWEAMGPVKPLFLDLRIDELVSQFLSQHVPVSEAELLFSC